MAKGSPVEGEGTLRDRVARALAVLGAGLLRHPDNDELRRELAAGSLAPRAFYQRLLRLVFRLLFLAAGEERGLVSPAGLTGERLRAGDWPHLVPLLAGDPGGPPGRGVDGFSGQIEPLPWLPCLALDREVLDEVRDVLLGPSEPAPGCGRAADVDELGRAFAELLELHPRLEPDPGVFVLARAAGHERKTSGSYYTPASLVDSLLEAALDPVLERAAARPQPEEAILRLTVCDPACGTGHLLLAAARRIARRLAALQSETGAPTLDAAQEALLGVAARCIHGVDVSPLAAELCRLSLWLETSLPGRPLPSLKQRVRCGNALLGATPALLARGIPDAAFRACEGDDPQVVATLRRRNREERRARGGRAAGREAAAPRRCARGPTSPPLAAASSSPTPWAADVLRLRADGWAAAFLWPKTRELQDAAPTQGVWEQLGGVRPAHSEEAAPGLLERARQQIRQLAARFRFFHWHQEFSAVFRIPGPGEAAPENAEAGWSGGFDCVVGNPPWERVKFQEKEWIAQHLPAAARARSAALRKRLLAEQGARDPDLLSAWRERKRAAQGVLALLRYSGRYPLCGAGDIDSYALFAELACSLLAPGGRAGLIVPTGIATGETTSAFFRTLLARRRLVSLYDFVNRKGLFPGVTGLQRFCLLTLAGRELPPGEPARCVFLAQDVRDLRDADRVYALDAADVALLNPGSGTCPVFADRRAAEIAKGIYRRVPVLGGDGRGARDGGWQVRFQRLLDMTNDAKLLRLQAQQGGTGRENGSYLPVYEGKMVAMYDHRAASIEFRAANELRQQQRRLHSAAQHADPCFRNSAYLSAPEELMLQRLGIMEPLPWFLVFKRVTSASNMRTLVSCILPWSAVSYTLYVVRFPAAQQPFVPGLLANMCSFVADWLVRQKTTQPSLPMGVAYQVPFLPPETLAAPARFSPAERVIDWLTPRVLELCYTSWDLQGFAHDYGCTGPPFGWDEERRFRLRCELDAAFFLLYGLQREEAAYVLDSFTAVRRKDLARWGEERTKRQVLLEYDTLARRALG